MSSADIDRRHGEVRPEGPVSEGDDPAPGAAAPIVTDTDEELARVLRCDNRWGGQLLRPAGVAVRGGRG